LTEESIINYLELDELSCLIVSHSSEEEHWYLSLFNNDFARSRQFFFTCNQASDYWWRQVLAPIIKDENCSWEAVESAFNPREIRNDFITEC
jgi:hypothetical protein